MNEQLVITGIFMSFALIEAIKGQLFNKSSEVSDDLKVELISTITLLAVSQPLILWTVDVLLSNTLPDMKDAYVTAPVLLQIACFLIFDDMAQYWWHRASHTYRPLYNLHRAHHNGKYMSVRIVYRNNIFYYLMMPSIWLSGVMVFLGFGWVYAGYLIVKLTVIIGAHSEWKWDAFLYKRPWLNPLTWIVERTISTPSTHSAHHGLDPEDGVTNYKGNYGNLLFFWDILFGTAKITREYPPAYGISGMFRADWKEQLVWPLYKTPRKPKS